MSGFSRFFALVFSILALTASVAEAQPSFSKAFQPATIGPGSVATLVFTINNTPVPADGPGGPTTDLAFTDTLPAAVTIASAPAVATTCGGIVTAPAGGTTIDLSGGSVADGAQCTVRVKVTSATPGTHTNVSGDLTSSAGNSGNAIADLMVVTDRPGFSKSFSPNPAALGSRVRLTFVIDNTANPSAAFNLAFIDNLPPNVVVANPADASTTCSGGSPTATPGTGTVSLGDFSNPSSVAATSSCTVSVDVVPNSTGALANVSGELTSTPTLIGTARSSGFAAATLNVPADPLVLIKSFTDDPVPPGGTATLQFTVLNRNRFDAATGITFSDDLTTVLAGLAALGTPLADPCGAGSVLSGSTLLTLTGGNLPAEGSCTFSVQLQVPAAAANGSYPNTTSQVSGDVVGSPVTGNAATDDLFVAAAPLVTKSFTDDPVGSGGTVTLEFTITNTSPTFTATDIAFTDVFDLVLPTAVSVPANGFCGAGSMASFTPAAGNNAASLAVTGANLAPGASCTFQLVLDVAPGVTSGLYPNATTAPTATVDGETVVGNPATDDLEIVGAPRLLKEFTDDPVDPGDTVTLQFTLTHDAFAPGDATGIGFTDDLSAVIPGLAAVGLPQNDVCGLGSTISGTTLLTFSGGTLAPGESCTFAVSLQVPAAGVNPGSYPNSTSDVTATVQGVTATSDPAADNLRIAGLQLSKSFTDDPVIPGGTVTLEFTVANVSPTAAATNIFFTDDLDGVLSGLVATGLPLANICGAGSALTGSAGNTFLTFSGGSLTAGTSCTFSVVLQVPAGAASGLYPNSTSLFSATVGGSTVAFDNASDTLIVDADLLVLGKTFTDDPVIPGGTVTLEFSVTNLSATATVTGITFSDNLAAAVPGLAAVGLPANNVCGAGSQISGTTTVTLTGGSLAPGANCTFTVTVQVPAGAPVGTFVNVTGQATGTAGGLGVTGDPAMDALRILGVLFDKAFAGPTTATGTVDLTFTIQNLDTANGVSGLGFTDNLGAVLPGLVATGLPQSGVCGAGSTLSGTSVLSLSGGNLGPSGSCSFPVTLQVPAGAAPGSYLNSTSGLSAGGLAVSTAATDTLVVEPPPTFAKTFAPSAVGLGGTSTLTFIIDNTASALAATALDFTDSLPAGLTVASPANASTTCSGGTITANPGSGTIAYTGGSVAAGASCTVQADVTAGVSGSLVNVSGDLTSSSGNSGPATDTLTVDPPPGFSKAFAPAAIAAGGVSTLTFSVDNSGSVNPATALDFTDSLPAGVVVASPANASTTCTGGTVTAVPGSGVISYTGGTVGAGATCTVQADVTAAATGSYVNVSGDLTSSLGNSGPATDTLDVVGGDLVMSKTFVVNPVLPGGSIDLEFTITNLSATFALTSISFSDDLDAVVPGLVSVGLPAADVCGAGSQLSGTSVIALSGGTLAASASCTFSVTLAVPADAPFGTFACTTSDLTATAQGVPVTAPPATADLIVDFLQASKSFAAGTVPAGTETTLTFTIVNPDPSNPASNIEFTDDLDAVIPGLVAVDTPLLDVCGAGSQLSGASLLMLTGGSLPAGGSCTFSVTLAIPVTTPDGDYTNLTSPLSATVGGSPVIGGPASAAQAVLRVGASVLAIPTLGGWALLLLAGLLAAVAVRRMRTA